MAEAEEKTQQPTPRRRQKAREQGQVARSRELTGIFALGGCLVALSMMGGYLLTNLSEAFVHPLFAPREGLLGTLRQTSLKGFRAILPLLLMPFIVAVFGSLLQGGVVFRPFKLELEKVNPFEGIKRIFSRYAILEFLKGLIKFVAGGVLLYLLVKKTITEMAGAGLLGLGQSLQIAWAVLMKTLTAGFFLFLVIAVVDYINERWRFERSLRMSPEELKEEYRETEGDPLVRARIRSIQREMARRRMMQEVPKATVVITNPNHIAVALKYERSRMQAPRVIAKGSGYIALKIREIARKYHIPIVEDRPLARALFKVDIGAEIPENLYRAVARIIAFIYRLKGEMA